MTHHDEQSSAKLEALASRLDREPDAETAAELARIRRVAAAEWAVRQSRPAPRAWWPAGLATAAVLVLAVAVTLWPARETDGPDGETLALLASDLPAMMEPVLLEEMDELMLMDAEALLLEEADEGDNPA